LAVRKWAWQSVFPANPAILGLNILSGTLPAPDVTLFTAAQTGYRSVECDKRVY
jgi:hypothetical protein